MSVCPEAGQMTAPDMQQLWLQQQVLEDRIPIMFLNVQDNLATMTWYRERERRAWNVCQPNSLVPLYSGLSTHEQR
eukprot:14273109-Heterocapsa_arctica.AAC.1